MAEAKYTFTQSGWAILKFDYNLFGFVEVTYYDTEAKADKAFQIIKHDDQGEDEDWRKTVASIDQCCYLFREAREGDWMSMNK